MRKLEPSTVLVALMPSRADWAIALNEHWYRIPVRSAPPGVREKKLTHIAFYFPQEFGAERYSVRWYAEVTSITKHERVELLPQEAWSPKAGEERYRIAFGDLKELPKPIIAHHGRRILFIPTTQIKLFNATELNDLFNDSPLEEMLWEQLKKQGIPVDRQYYIEYDEHKFQLDFAVFCKQRALAIECDGKAWHNPDERVQSDKNRDAVLQSQGWSVLRFTAEDITRRLPRTMDYVTRTVNELGGVQMVAEPESFRYLRERGDMQGTLFD